MLTIDVPYYLEHVSVLRGRGCLINVDDGITLQTDTEVVEVTTKFMGHHLEGLGLCSIPRRFQCSETRKWELKRISQMRLGFRDLTKS